MRPGDVIAILALGVSIYTTVRGFQLQNFQNRYETQFARIAEVRFIGGKRVEMLPINQYIGPVLGSIQNPPAVIAVWFELRITNNGIRTFSVEDLKYGYGISFNGDRAASVFSSGSYGYPKLEGVYSKPYPIPSNLTEWPKTIDSGEQIRMYGRAILPLGSKTHKLLKNNRVETFDGLQVSLFEEYNNSSGLEQSELKDEDIFGPFVLVAFADGEIKELPIIFPDFNLL